MGRGREYQGSDEREESAAVLRRAEWLWRGCMCLPFVYLLFCKWIDVIWLEPRGGGLLMASDEAYRVGLGIVICLAVADQFFVIGVHRHFAKRIGLVREDVVACARLFHKRTFVLAACSDSICFLGVCLFFLFGDWNTLTAFCLTSYLFYAQAFPHARCLR